MEIGNWKLSPEGRSPFGGKIGAKRRGVYLPMILIMSTLFMAFAVALVTLASANLRSAAHYERYISSMEVAEAGINYYMWHLSHNNTDYCDGGTCSGSAPYGPFTHQYKDNAGREVGSYDLYITPPQTGEAITHVRAVGRVSGSNSARTIIADLGMPSFARYAFLSNTECWFGDTETTNGPVHSNIGVHFDGTANGIVSAASSKYTPTADFGGDGAEHDGVWGNGGPQGFWVFPVPAIDFNRVSVDFVDLKTSASTGGISLDDSKASGYYLKLNSNDTIDIYKVTRERTSGITATLLQTVVYPANGIIYAADNVWIDGTASKSLTVAAEITSGSHDAVIKIKDNLLYSTKDGTIQVGLVSEGNIEVPQYAVSNLEIDAALLSQKGHVWFPNVSGVIKNSISVYGAISTYDYWTWSWVNGSGTVTSGYRTTSQTYDPFLTLKPPPEFPTTGTFSVLSWREE